MEGVTTIGLDIAKSVFQVHGVNTAGKVVVQRRLTYRSTIRRYVRYGLSIQLVAATHASNGAVSLMATGLR